MKKLKIAMLTRTVPVSVTGTFCRLRCKHCNAHYLKHMLALSTLKIPDGVKSLLVSGGSNEEGKVPLLEHLDEIRKLKYEGYRLNFHVGLVEDEEARLLSEVADAISFDFVGSDETISYVYNLRKNVSDYVRTFEALRKYTSNVYPHVTVGLRCGELSHEFNAVDILANYEPKKVVFIVFIPTVGTPFSNCPVPTLKDIKRVFSYARGKFKGELILGCMYPKGRYRDLVARCAVEENFDVVTQPSKEFIVSLEREGYSLTFSDECCVL